MPKIQWTNLPPALRDHLFDRLRERKITVDLYQLEGKYPKTFCFEGNLPKARSYDRSDSTSLALTTCFRSGAGRRRRYDRVYRLR